MILLIEPIINSSPKKKFDSIINIDTHHTTENCDFKMKFFFISQHTKDDDKIEPKTRKSQKWDFWSHLSVVTLSISFKWYTQLIMSSTTHDYYYYFSPQSHIHSMSSGNNQKLANTIVSPFSENSIPRVLINLKFDCLFFLFFLLSWFLSSDMFPHFSFIFMSFTLPPYHLFHFIKLLSPSFHFRLAMTVI